jgi:hypothetical protein
MRGDWYPSDSKRRMEEDEEVMGYYRAKNDSRGKRCKGERKKSELPAKLDPLGDIRVAGANIKKLRSVSTVMWLVAALEVLLGRRVPMEGDEEDHGLFQSEE